MKLNENLSVLFLLEKNKMGRDGTAPLTARITVNGSRAEFSLGKKVPPDCWDQEAELVARAKELLESKSGEFPVLRRYLDSWSEFPSP